MASRAQFRCQHKNFKYKLNVNIVNVLISFKMFQRSPYGGGKDLMEGGEEGA